MVLLSLKWKIDERTMKTSNFSATNISFYSLFCFFWKSVKDRWHGFNIIQNKCKSYLTRQSAIPHIQNNWREIPQNTHPSITFNKQSHVRWGNIYQHHLKSHPGGSHLLCQQSAILVFEVLRTFFGSILFTVICIQIITPSGLQEQYHSPL